MRIEYLKCLAREKLVEKGIDWGQVYTDKTMFLKEQFESVVGPGSYFRFEGTDISSGDSYYCIIGPAKVHKPRAKFFAGVRKLPATFSAGGKYFDSLDSAARYARETWGVPTPKELKPYTSSALYGISSKIDKWKKQREEDEKENNDNDGNEEEKESKKEKKEKENIKKLNELIDKASSSFKSSGFFAQIENMIIKEAISKHAMSKPQIYRKDYSWWDLDDVVRYQNSPENAIPSEALTKTREWNRIRQERPKDAAVAIDETARWETSTYAKLNSEYGLTGEDAKKLIRAYIGYDPHHGFYVLAVGPYLPDERTKNKIIEEFGEEELDKRMDKFSHYIYKPSSKAMDKFYEGSFKAADKYKQSFGVDLEPSDFELKFPKLSGSSFLGSKDSQDTQENQGKVDTISSMQWFPYIPYPVDMLKQYNALSKQLTGQYSKEEVKNVALQKLATYYNAEPKFISDLIQHGSVAISNEWKKVIDLANLDRRNKNKNVNSQGFDFDESEPMLRTGTMVQPNENGVIKIVNHYISEKGLERYTDPAITKAFSNRDIKKTYGTEENLKNAMSTDFIALRRVYKFMRDLYYFDLGINSKSKAELKTIPAEQQIIDWSGFRKLNVKRGSQNFSGLPRDVNQLREIKLRKEIAEALAEGAKTIKDIQIKLSEDKKRIREVSRQRKGVGQAAQEIPAKYISEQLKIIRNTAEEQGITNALELAQEFQIMYDDLYKQRGSSDLETALSVASLYFTSTEVDPTTRAKYVTDAKRKKIPFKIKEGEENITTDDLKGIRGVSSVPSQRDIIKEPQEPQEIQEIPEIITPQEIPVDVVTDFKEDILTPEIIEQSEESKINKEKEGILPGKKEEITEQFSKVDREILESSDQEEKERSMRVKRTITKTFNKTIRNLIKIATELDNDGKNIAAEEIHKVIRKYQERI